MRDYDIRRNEYLVLSAIWKSGDDNPFGNPARIIKYDTALELGSKAISDDPVDKLNDPDRVMDTGVDEVITDLESLGFIHTYQQEYDIHSGIHNLIAYVWMPVFIGELLADAQMKFASTMVDSLNHSEIAVLSTLLRHGPGSETYLRGFLGGGFEVALEKHHIEYLLGTDTYRITTLGERELLRWLVITTENAQGDHK